MHIYIYYFSFIDDLILLTASAYDTKPILETLSQYLLGFSGAMFQ